MASSQNNNETIKASSELLNIPKTPQEELLKLQEQVEAGQFDNLVDSLMGTAVENKNVPAAKIDAFVTSLNSKQAAALETFLTGQPIDIRVTTLLTRIKALKNDGTPIVTDSIAAGMEGLSESTRKIVGAIDAGITRLTAGGRLNEIAAKVGFKGEIGPKQFEFIKNFFIGYAAKLFEGVTASLWKMNDSIDLTKILTIPLELRLINIPDPEHKKLYRTAYLKKARESKGAFQAPTLDEVLHQTTPQPVAVASVKPAEAIPNTDEPVNETKKEIVLMSGVRYSITRSNGKTIIEVGDKKREVTVPGNVSVKNVFVRQPTFTDSGAITLELMVGSKKINIDPRLLQERMLASEKGKKQDFKTADATTIELVELLPA